MALSLGVEGYQKLKKGEVIDAIIERSAGMASAATAEAPAPPR